MAQRDAGMPGYLHRREVMAANASKLLGDNLGADILATMSIEDALFKAANLGSGPLAVQDIFGQNGTAPTAAAGANAGTSPPSPVVAVGSTDTRGQITFGTGTTPAAGAQAVITFGKAYPTGYVPNIQLTPTTVGAANLLEYVTSASNTGFTISLQAAPAASQANTVYGFNYRVS